MLPLWPVHPSLPETYYLDLITYCALVLFSDRIADGNLFEYFWESPEKLQGEMESIDDRLDHTIH